MNVASLELCKELYELSGWGGDVLTAPDEPARYTLGYLMRRLPPRTVIRRLMYEPSDDSNGRTDAIGYSARLERYGTFQADTPEDAAAKLCIKLFKQGVLNRE